MTWKNESQRHQLAGRGIKTKAHGERYDTSRTNKKYDTIKISIPPNTVKVYDEYSMQYDWFEGMQQEDVWMDFMDELNERGILIKRDSYDGPIKLINTTDKPISYTNHQFYNDNQFQRGEW